MYAIRYSGPFGFIKPWTAVRDGETYSQQFLTPSIVEGIEKKLFPELLVKNENELFIYRGIFKVKSYRLSYQSIDVQQERTWAKGGISVYKEDGIYKTNMGIIKRGIMINPTLHILIEEKKDAEKAFKNTICLCRNEDLLFPEALEEIEMSEFDLIPGFEFISTEPSKGFKVGYNRFRNESMYGHLKIVGNPVG